MTKTQILSLNEAKKHSVRYDADKVEADPLVTSIYVLKGHLPRPFPPRIKITVEAEG